MDITKQAECNLGDRPRPVRVSAFNVTTCTPLGPVCWALLGYVDHAEELTSRFLQCFPKNRISAQAALNHEYFSHLPPRIWELQDMSTIFTVAGVKLQIESGDSIQVCARRNSQGKDSTTGSKH
ncbi:unnamed protein product [Arctogadus glacialis]